MRRHSTRTLAVAVSAALAVLACGEEIQINAIPEDETFSATLSGANEVPAVTTTLTGSAVFAVVEDSFLILRLDVAYPDTAGLRVWGAHIHRNPAGQNGPIIQNLFVGGSCTSTTGSRTLRQFSGQLAAAQLRRSSRLTDTLVSYDSLLTLLRNGNAYVNVHTARNCGGEVRGQVQ